jgi:Cytochrome c
MRLLTTLVVLAASLGVAVAQQPPTDQTKRGLELFLKSPKGVPCGTCHEINGQGKPVGPNLKNIGSYGMPRGIVMAIRMSSTESVQLITPLTGTAFPARVVEKKDGQYKAWNLTGNTPELVTLAEKDIKTVERDQKWKHPPASVEYTNAEFADIVGFIKWAATGTVKTVTADEVGSSQ